MGPVSSGALPRALSRGIALSGLLLSAGCDDARGWVRGAQAPHYTSYGDTAFLHVQPYGIVEVWYRTDHAAPRLHNGEAFDREVVHALVRCQPLVTMRGSSGLQYKISQVDLTLGGGRTVSRQRTTPLELAEQPWRRVETDGAELMAAQAACHFAKQRSSQDRVTR